MTKRYLVAAALFLSSCNWGPPGEGVVYWKEHRPAEVRVNPGFYGIFSSTEVRNPEQWILCVEKGLWGGCYAVSRETWEKTRIGDRVVQ